MSDRVQVIFRWNSEKLKQLKAWANLERLTLQEVLEALVTEFLEHPDSSLIAKDSKPMSDGSNVIAEVISRLAQVEETVSQLAPIQERLAVLESELGETVA